MSLPRWSCWTEAFSTWLARHIEWPPASGHSVEALLLVEFERDQQDALRQALALAESAVMPWAVSVDIAYSGDADRLWAIRHAASPILAGLPEDRRSLQVIEDACVPIERMGEYIASVRRMAAELELPVVLFGHAGDGHIHVNLLPELARPGWQDRVAALLEDVTQLVKRLGGTPSGEHGDGRLRANALEQIYGPQIVELFREIKLAFDPSGIFNPGVILPSGEPADQPPQGGFWRRCDPRRHSEGTARDRADGWVCAESIGTGGGAA